MKEKAQSSSFINNLDRHFHKQMRKVVKMTDIRKMTMSQVFRVKNVRKLILYIYIYFRIYFSEQENRVV